MSSQFNYELDERQIKLLMLDTEIEYSEDAWSKFNSIQLKDSKPKNDLFNHLPKINIGISRSIIIPLFFIIAVGSLSALLFSFVDFKKKEEAIKEIPITKVISTSKKGESENTQKQQLKVQKPIPVVTDKKTEVPAITLEKKETSKSISIVKPIDNKMEKRETEHKKKKKKERKRIVVEDLPSINTTENLNKSNTEPELDIR